MKNIDLRVKHETVDCVHYSVKYCTVNIYLMIPVKSYISWLTVTAVNLRYYFITILYSFFQELPVLRDVGRDFFHFFSLTGLFLSPSISIWTIFDFDFQLQSRICTISCQEIDSQESILPGWESIPGLLKRFTNYSTKLLLENRFFAFSTLNISGEL